MLSSPRFTRTNYVESLANFSPPDRVEKIHFRHPKGYVPDSSDQIFRNPNVRAERFHILAEGESGIIIAAALYYPFVDQSKTPEKVPVFNPKDEEWKRVVCKRYATSKLATLNDGYTRLLREVEFSRFHRHENIVKFYETFPEFDGSGNITHYWLVSERMDHNMEQYFSAQGQKKGEKLFSLIGSFLVQLLRGLDYLHQNGNIHRNIEPRQIGYSQNKSQFKILNFGLSRPINLNADHSTNVDAPPRYKAIEMLVKVKYTTKIDIWAAALVTIEWLGEKLFQPSLSDEETMIAIRRFGSTKFILDQIVDLLGMPKDKYKSIFGKVLDYDAKDSRLSQKLVDLCRGSGLSDLVDFRVQDFCDLLMKMLDADQNKRLSADECLKHPFLFNLNKRLQTHALDRQPVTDEEMKDRNQKHKELLNKQLLSGYTRLSFQN